MQYEIGLVSHSVSLNAMPLEITFRARKRFGGWQDAHQAIGVHMGQYQLSMLTSIRLRSGQRVLLRIGHEELALRDVLATIDQVEQRGADFIYHLNFDLSQLDQASQAGADMILDILRARLKPSRS